MTDWSFRMREDQPLEDDTYHPGDTVYIEGYWRTSEHVDKDDKYPWPVPNQSDNTEFLKKLMRVQNNCSKLDIKTIHYRTFSISRLDGSKIGSTEFKYYNQEENIFYIWPEGYRHYIKNGVPPTERFVNLIDTLYNKLD